jgi:hypothetical protein
MLRRLAIACLFLSCNKGTPLPLESTLLHPQGDTCGAHFEHLPDGKVLVTNGPKPLCALVVRFKVSSTEMSHHHWSDEIDLAPDRGLPAGATVQTHPVVHERSEELGGVEVVRCSPCS